MASRLFDIDHERSVDYLDVEEDWAELLTQKVAKEAFQYLSLLHICCLVIAYMLAGDTTRYRLQDRAKTTFRIAVYMTGAYLGMFVLYLLSGYFIDLLWQNIKAVNGAEFYSLLAALGIYVVRLWLLVALVNLIFTALGFCYGQYLETIASSDAGAASNWDSNSSLRGLFDMRRVRSVEPKVEISRTDFFCTFTASTNQRNCGIMKGDVTQAGMENVLGKLTWAIEDSTVQLQTGDDAWLTTQRFMSWAVWAATLGRAGSLVDIVAGCSRRFVIKSIGVLFGLYQADVIYRAILRAALPAPTVDPADNFVDKREVDYGPGWASGGSSGSTWAASYMKNNEVQQYFFNTLGGFVCDGDSVVSMLDYTWNGPENPTSQITRAANTRYSLMYAWNNFVSKVSGMSETNQGPSRRREIITLVERTVGPDMNVHDYLLSGRWYRTDRHTVMTEAENAAFDAAKEEYTANVVDTALETLWSTNKTEEELVMLEKVGFNAEPFRTHSDAGDPHLTHAEQLQAIGTKNSGQAQELRRRLVNMGFYNCGHVGWLQGAVFGGQKCCSSEIHSATVREDVKKEAYRFDADQLRYYHVAIVAKPAR